MRNTPRDPLKNILKKPARRVLAVSTTARGFAAAEALIAPRQGVVDNWTVIAGECSERWFKTLVEV